MRKRWAALGMLEAQRSFRRIKGHADLPALTKTIRTHTNPETVTPPHYDHQAARTTRDHHRTSTDLRAISGTRHAVEGEHRTKKPVGAAPDLEATTDDTIAGVRVRRYRPHDTKPGVGLYFHGGGWVLGSRTNPVTIYDRCQCRFWTTTRPTDNRTTN